MSDYLVFETLPRAEKRKTFIVDVKSKSNGFLLGQLRWFGRWRQYCWFPAADCVFSAGCMADIQQKLAELKAGRKRVG